MNPVLLRAILASLPLLGVTQTWPSGFIYGGLGVGILFLTLFIFWAISYVLPQKFYRICLLLLAVLSVGGVATCLRFSPKLLLSFTSFCFLVDPDFLRRQKNWIRLTRRTFLGAVFFWILVVGHGIFSDLLTAGIGGRFFQVPAGSYLWMATAALFLNPTRTANLQRQRRK